MKKFLFLVSLLLLVVPKIWSQNTTVVVIPSTEWCKKLGCMDGSDPDYKKALENHNVIQALIISKNILEDNGIDFRSLKTIINDHQDSENLFKIDEAEANDLLNFADRYFGNKVNEDLNSCDYIIELTEENFKNKDRLVVQLKEPWKSNFEWKKTINLSTPGDYDQALSTIIPEVISEINSQQAEMEKNGQIGIIRFLISAESPELSFTTEIDGESLGKYIEKIITSDFKCSNIKQTKDSLIFSDVRYFPVKSNSGFGKGHTIFNLASIINYNKKHITLTDLDWVTIPIGKHIVYIFIKKLD